MAGAWDGLALGEGELEEMRDRAERKRASGGRLRDGRICRCGHPAGRHLTEEVLGRGEVTRCRPGQAHCACGELQPVWQVGNVRPYLAKTEGAGGLHALLVGLDRAVERLGEEAAAPEWLVEKRCAVCQEEGPVLPAPIQLDSLGQGRVSYKSERITALVCRGCLAKIPALPKPREDD